MIGSIIGVLVVAAIGVWVSEHVVMRAWAHQNKVEANLARIAESLNRIERALSEKR